VLLPLRSSGALAVNFNTKTSGWTLGLGTTRKGVDLNAQGSVNGTPLLEVDVESFDEKPWKKPGADLTDYFNYGFNEESWKIYCDKQRRVRMSLEVMSLGSSKALGRTSYHSDRSLSKSDSFYDSASSSSSRKLSNSINVIGGQSGTISRVEGRRRHNADGSQIQVISEPSSDGETTPTKMPFFPPNIPPPPLCSSPLSDHVTGQGWERWREREIVKLGSLCQGVFIDVCVCVCVEQHLWERRPFGPHFPSPPHPDGKPSIGSGAGRQAHGWLDSSRQYHSRPGGGGYDARSAPPFPFPAGVYPPMLGGMASWPGLIDSAKAWEYYARRDSGRERERDHEKVRERGHERDRERDREREREKEKDRDREREKEKERERSLSSPSHNSDEERQRHRDHGERGHDRHRERSSREKEERQRERRHRQKDEGRHKFSRSSSSSSRRKRHSSEEGQITRRSRHKRQKHSHESRETNEEPSADQENQSEAAE
ncbi:pre-mRNA 3'-end-processing factor FIP1-like, partial [Clupea harengus]|uniref:Pre-mRNA 3'-end-processing factor FIP1-like n=1 Tax=Clupea harengus TaxID=7950 RepID=A0A8M1KTG8_CLUHA